MHFKMASNGSLSWDSWIHLNKYSEQFSPREFCNHSGVCEIPTPTPLQMEPEVSLPCLQRPANGSYHEPDEFSLYNPTLFS
jgi:hypothetical protein